MTACSHINSVWKDVYAHITSQGIYVPIVAYLLYLSSIISSNDSEIYPTSIPDSVRTITCYVDLIKSMENRQRTIFSVLQPAQLHRPSQVPSQHRGNPSRNQILHWMISAFFVSSLVLPNSRFHTPRAGKCIACACYLLTGASLSIIHRMLKKSISLSKDQGPNFFQRLLFLSLQQGRPNALESQKRISPNSRRHGLHI
ncbi:hypothetical protein IW262DRAFT_1395426 [Armillaria fumosa]|nr:hypothetical protein IW262DRAFT_1395426 [Armillaria fumosa]